ncbi:3'-5' exonuclease [Clostridium perfringens]|nr:3'-5' exonuclease [Clostridium perfringens]
MEEKNGLALKVSMFNCMARTQRAMQIYNTISSNLNIEDTQLENAIKCWTSKLKSSKANSLNDFLNYIETKDAQENLKEGTSNINITTIHGAKGLEFDEVVLFNFDDFNFSSQGDVEETRRLLYVAFTRAKEKLNLYFSKQNFYKQKECSCTVSPFLKELPGNYVWFEDYFKE